MKKFTKRRKFLINSELQYRLLLTSFFHIILFFAIIGLRLFTPLFIQVGKNASSAETQQAASVLLYLHANLWTAVLFSFLLVGLLSVRTSHKIAGPLYRITLIHRSLENGSLPKPVPCRKDDLLIAEIEAANQMLEKLRLQMQEIQKAQTGLHDAIATCSPAAGHASSGEIHEAINQIREKERQIADRIAYFKVE